MESTKGCTEAIPLLYPPDVTNETASKAYKQKLTRKTRNTVFWSLQDRGGQQPDLLHRPAASMALCHQCPLPLCQKRGDLQRLENKNKRSRGFRYFQILFRYYLGFRYFFTCMFMQSCLYFLELSVFICWWAEDNFPPRWTIKIYSILFYSILFMMTANLYKNGTTMV